MKTNRELCTSKCEYLRPKVEFADIVVERGFANSIEIVGKDEEVDAF